MAKKSIYMDTNVFTDIVEDIRNTAEKSVFSEDALSKIIVFENLTGDSFNGEKLGHKESK